MLRAMRPPVPYRAVSILDRLPDKSHEQQRGMILAAARTIQYVDPARCPPLHKRQRLVAHEVIGTGAGGITAAGVSSVSTNGVNFSGVAAMSSANT